ncbi:MAG TPA: ACT domain-containing protein [Methylomirabilota bacterium]|nr:ACT domain-containing protein [Methylomirabilota bacterium]
MTTEFTVAIPDVPGSLARLGQLLGDARVNIEAIQGFVGGGHGLVRFVPDSAEDAARALDAAGYAHTRRDVIVVRVLDEPGALGQLALVLAEAGINIDAIYVTTRGHMVLGVDDLTGAIHVAAGMAVMVSDD